MSPDSNIQPSATSTPSNGKTFWFMAGVFWLFLFAEVLDDVRQGIENLFLLFPVIVWVPTCVISVSLVRFVWHLFPHMAPRHTHTNTSGAPVLIGFLVGLALAIAWGKSPLFIQCYDSIKWMLLLLIAGWTLGLAYKQGGFYHAATSLLFGWLAGVVSCLTFLFLATFMSPKDIWDGTWMLGAIGVPYSIAATLYDCSKQHRTA